MVDRLTPRLLIAQIRDLVGMVLPYPKGKMLCRATRIDGPEGPIRIQRHPASKGDGWDGDKEESISSNMIWRYVNALNTRQPVSVDRVFAGSYNTRSVLETLVAACPSFHLCYPKVVTHYEGGVVKINTAHAHVFWMPEKLAHPIGTHHWLKDEESGYVTEVPSRDVYSEMEVTFTEPQEKEEPAGSKDRKENLRVHSQMQVLLSESASWLGLRSWVAVEDHGITVKGKNIMEHPHIVKDLAQEKPLAGYPNAIAQAKHIDCLWFNGGMPFAFEVEHTTGVTSGLSRLLRLHDRTCHLRTDYVIVAPDDDREEVLRKADEEQYSDMDLWYLPYTNIHELYGFSRRHTCRCASRMKSDFVKMFMEQINKAQ